MTILVDGYNIGMAQGTGVATYGHAFAESAHRLGHRVELLLGRDDLDNRSLTAGRIGREARKILDFVQAPFGLSALILDTGRAASLHNLPRVDTLWNRSRLFRAAKGNYRRTGLFTAVPMPHVQVAHWTYPLPIYVPGAKNIYTIHDMVPVTHPEMVQNGQEYGKLCFDIVKRADHIITVSEASKKDILTYLPIDSMKVTNTYLSIPASKHDDNDDNAVLRHHDLTAEGYFLFFGAIEPKKNLLRLLLAFEQSSVETPLVVVGKIGWNCDEDVEKLRQLATLDNGRRLLWLDYLPRHALFSLVRNAKAVLFPSLVEGFGLPALETMVQGVPLLAANIPALSEVTNGCALMVDPLSVASIRDGLEALDRDMALRRNLTSRGRTRAAFFSTARYDARLATLLRELL
jgi:glycosyltransferase involved in cell wall biosynthesis